MLTFLYSDRIEQVTIYPAGPNVESFYRAFSPEQDIVFRGGYVNAEWWSCANRIGLKD